MDHIYRQQSGESNRFNGQAAARQCRQLNIRPSIGLIVLNVICLPFDMISTSSIIRECIQKRDGDCHR
ncbi:hypothetical protein RDWZM_001496 [Blomia tropicalis]|uniref:Uncharacterized protein n=1 Tax=Blomia tropicalis TaxID=40697 RepID=A0A9Q0RQP4_BLOTA|nr:hypothetical protein RDWZM_001496 [Blomia tropicalis]